MNEKESKPIWLQEMNKITEVTKLKVDAIQKKLDEVHYGKGARPELKPPGSPPSFGKSFWGKEMAGYYKEQIEQTKKESYTKCSKMLENVNVNERAAYADEIKKGLEVTRPNSLQPQHKEEEKDLDASQNFLSKKLDHAKNEGRSVESKVSSLDFETTDNSASQAKTISSAEVKFEKSQENKLDITRRKDKDLE
ncbi:MAG TPA: hypothetical protein PLN13_03510 [Bacteroidia bacterium]|nr:hypothetical protein [Bacteroidia bacterium]HRH07622.1 hypothetical protein [Bacteroidia bacterium]